MTKSARKTRRPKVARPNLKKCDECKNGHHGFCQMMSCRCTYRAADGKHPKFITGGDRRNPDAYAKERL